MRRELTVQDVEEHPMRLPRPRMRAIAMVVVGMAGLLAVIWYSWPPGPRVYATVLRADRLTVYEGLPHRDHEEGAFQEEWKTKQTSQLLS